MRQKTLKFLVTFPTTTGAMAMEKYCHAHEVPGRLIPVPRQISAGCGMAWCAPLECTDRIRSVLRQEDLDFDGEYEIMA